MFFSTHVQIKVDPYWEECDMHIVKDALVTRGYTVANGEEIYGLTLFLTTGEKLAFGFPLDVGDRVWESIRNDWRPRDDGV